jgi:hypothetical protein
MNMGKRESQIDDICAETLKKKCADIYVKYWTSFAQPRRLPRWVAYGT